jgi:hypothetical protein
MLTKGRLWYFPLTQNNYNANEQRELLCPTFISLDGHIEVKLADGNVVVLTLTANKVNKSNSLLDLTKKDIIREQFRAKSTSEAGNWFVAIVGASTESARNNPNFYADNAIFKSLDDNIAEYEHSISTTVLETVTAHHEATPELMLDKVVRQKCAFGFVAIGNIIAHFLCCLKIGAYEMVFKLT